MIQSFAEPKDLALQANCRFESCSGLQGLTKEVLFTLASHCWVIFEEELLSRGRILFSNLLDWLNKGASNDDAATYFREIGTSRIQEGFPLTEVFYALYLEKKVLWSFVAWKDDVTGILKAVDAIEFMTVINNYFDLGDFFIIKGYPHEMYTHISETGKFTQEELENIFTSGALFQEKVREIREKIT